MRTQSELSRYCRIRSLGGQVCGFLLILGMMLVLLCGGAYAANNPYEAQRSDDGAIHGSEFVSYGGYYYALYPTQGAITRHKPDGSENVVFYNDRGYNDLTRGKNRVGFDQKSVGDKYLSFAIYNDKIYVAVILNAYEKSGEVYPAIYRMNLDGTGMTPLLWMKDGGDNIRDWCIWNDKIYGIYGVNGGNVFTANLDGSNLKTTDFYGESKELGAKALGHTTTKSDGSKEQHWSDVGVEASYIYNGEFYCATSLLVDNQHTLYKMNAESNHFTEYKIMDFKGYVKFVAEGRAYVSDVSVYSSQWWRVKTDGSGSAEWLGRGLYGLTAFKGNLYYMDQPSNGDQCSAYKSAGLGAVTAPSVIAPAGCFAPSSILYPSGDMVLGDNQVAKGRIICALDGSRRGYDLAYEDRYNYPDSSVGNAFNGSVIRPAYVALELGSIDNNTYGGDILNRKLIISDWAKEALKFKKGGDVMGYDFTKTITRLQFCNTMMGSYMSMNHGIDMMHWLNFAREQPNFADTSDLYVKYCYALNIIDGVDATHFNPSGSITREEMAVFLLRTMKAPDMKLNLDHYTVDENKNQVNIGSPMIKGDLGQFSDSGQISSSAREAMSYCVGMGIIQGNGGKLDPKGLCTIEETLVYIERLRAFKAALSKPLEDDTYYMLGVLGNNVYINSQGQGELNNAEPRQKFKFKFLYTQSDQDDYWMYYYFTVQTEEGRYLGIQGDVKDGSRLVTMDTPYVWEIRNAGNVDYKNRIALKDTASTRWLNAKSWGKSNGTPLIMWANNGGFGDNKLNNARFTYDRVK